jgi:trigger factor
MYENQTNDMIRDFDMRLRSQGMDMNTYMQYMGVDANALKGMYREDAEKRVKLRLALETIAAKENIEVTNADVEDEYAKMAEQYNMEVDKLKELFDKNSTAAMKGDYIAQKALHFVTDAAVEVAPKAAEEE